MTDVANQTHEDQRKVAPFRPRRLGHANLWVSDYEHAYDYYRNIVGFEHAYIQPDNKASFVSNGNTYHDYGLIDVTSHHAKVGQKPGLNHFAIELRTESEMVEGYREAKKSGVKFDFLFDHDVAHSVYRFDPDGNLLELYADVISDWRAMRSGVIIKEKPAYIPGESSEPVRQEMFPKNPEILVVKEAVFHPKRVAHVSLITKDYGRMFDFYTRDIGLKPWVGDRSSDFCILGGDVSSGDLVLHRPLEGSLPGLHHVGVEVPSEASLETSKAALPAKGLTLDSEVSHPARKSLTIFAMDGIRTQFFVDRDWRPSALGKLDRRTALALL